MSTKDLARCVLVHDRCQVVFFHDGLESDQQFQQKQVWASIKRSKLLLARARARKWYGPGQRVVGLRNNSSTLTAQLFFVFFALWARPESVSLTELELYPYCSTLNRQKKLSRKGTTLAHKGTPWPVTIKKF